MLVPLVFEKDYWKDRPDGTKLRTSIFCIQLISTFSLLCIVKNPNLLYCYLFSPLVFLITLYISVLIIVCTLAFKDFVVNFKTKLSFKKNIKKESQPNNKTSIIKELYLSWKNKYCKEIVYKHKE